MSTLSQPASLNQTNDTADHAATKSAVFCRPLLLLPPQPQISFSAAVIFYSLDLVRRLPFHVVLSWGRAWGRHGATSRTVPGSIPGGVIGDIFPWLPPTEPCALGSTQPLKMSTTDFSWGKSGRCVWLTTYRTSRKSGALSTRNPLGHLGLLRD